MAIKHLDNLTFGIQEIDTLYREFSRAYDDFSNKVGECTEEEALPGLLEFLENYVRSQFKYEELLIVKSSYEDGGEHLGEHGQFIADLEGFQGRFREEGASKKLLGGWSVRAPPDIIFR